MSQVNHLPLRRSRSHPRRVPGSCLGSRWTRHRLIRQLPSSPLLRQQTHRLKPRKQSSLLHHRLKRHQWWLQRKRHPIQWQSCRSWCRTLCRSLRFPPNLYLRPQRSKNSRQNSGIRPVRLRRTRLRPRWRRWCCRCPPSRPNLSLRSNSKRKPVRTRLLKRQLLRRPCHGIKLKKGLLPSLPPRQAWNRA